MARSLGVLTIDVIAKVGGFVEGLDKAQREAQRKAQQIAKAVGVATGALATMAVAAVGAGAAWTREVSELAVQVERFAQLSGTTNEQFQRLSLGASTVGISAEKLADIFKDVQDKVGDFMQTGGGAMADFFETVAPKVGVTAEQFRRLSGPDALQLYVSSLEKANLSQSDMVFYMEAIASDATALLPLLQQNGKAMGDMGEYAKSVGAILDDGLIKASKELDVEMKKVDMVILGLKNSIARELIPQVLEATRSFREWIVQSGLVETMSKAIAIAFDIVSRGCTVIAASIRTVTLQLIALYEAGKAAWSVLTLDFKGAAANWSNAKTAASMSVEAFQGAIDAVTRTRPVTVPVTAAPVAGNAGRLSPRVQKPKGGGGGEDPFKAALDAQMKALERVITQERELLQERNKFLDMYNDMGVLSIQDYYDRQRAILEEATATQSKAYADQIKALQDYIAKAPKAQDRARAQEQINDILEKQAKLQRDAGSAAIEAGFKQQKAAEDALKAYRDVNAQLLELQGRVGEAARIRLGDQFESVEKLARANGRDDVLGQIDEIKRLGAAQADLNKLSNEYRFIQESLGIQTDRIALAQQLGTDGELQGLVKLGEARRASYEQLQGIAAEYERIAAASGDPNMILGADRMKLELEELAATLDPLADKFNTMFADAAGNAFADWISGTKSAKDAFKDMVNSIVSDITRMAIKDIAKSLFSGGGSASGGMGFNFGSLLSGLFGGARANGGPTDANKLYRVNERGPELFSVNGADFLMTGDQPGHVTPNHKLGGSGFVQNLTFNVAGQMDRRTVDQTANEARRRTQMAARLT